ncbi:carbonic anhydrase 2-like [Onthophagus taurus]|uniref:carbonic anhydrase 2-like n=1 Tax=Onthophagus taurus TaxID=166361 RepID=UPI000C203973|nr:carbonic anhydrase 2-like [Onthophagus taurus]
MLDWLSNYSSLEQMAIAAVIVFLTVVIAEIVDYSRILTSLESANPAAKIQYGYDSHNGPVCWKLNFPESKGKQQSPIDILTKIVACVPAETQKPLKFSMEYYGIPTSMVLVNDGHCLNLYGCWPSNRYPKISGGSLHDTYRFDSIRFRWGPSDDEGSEHTIDSIRFAMEIQAMHIKRDKACFDLTQAAQSHSVMGISYLFQVTPIDNPYLEPILDSLKDVQEPNSTCPIEPFPLSWLTPPFSSKYFMYLGSLTFPPCSENVEWLVLSEPLSISSRQLRKFRKLCSVDGQMICNTRPVQELNNRCVCFYD